MRCILIVLISFLTLSSQAQFLLDGFQQPKGKKIIAISSGIESWNGYFLQDGSADFGRTAIITGAYAQWAATDKIRMAVSIPFIAVQKGESRLQDGVYQIMYNPIRIGKGSLFLSLGASTPLSDYATETGQAIGQQASKILTGLGYHLQLSKLFITVQSQYFSASSPTPNGVQEKLRIGGNIKSMFAAFNVEAQQAFGGSNYRDGMGDPFTSLGVDYVKAGVELYHQVTSKMGLAYHLRRTIDGRNTGKGTEFFISAVWTL